MKEITLTFNGISTKLISDAEGLFNLNVLHKASGGMKRHSSNYWANNQQTIAFIQEIQNTGNPVLKVKRGKGGGTYVVEQLVYHYASWISPEMAWGYAAVNIIHQF